MQIVMDAFLIVVPRPTAVLRLPVFSRFVSNCLGFYEHLFAFFPMTSDCIIHRCFVMKLLEHEVVFEKSETQFVGRYIITILCNIGELIIEVQ